ncbi:hypothetical protein B1T48_14005 [Mycobacterium persicum]|nr:hypothetical protein B1T48_14005 [Mycobacterium persicum]
MESMADVVGRNAQVLRGNHTFDEVAAAVSAAGLKWGRGRVYDLENGGVVPRLDTLILLCQAFSGLLGREVRLSDLLRGDGRVDVADQPVPLSTVRDALAGAPVNLPEPRVSTTDLLKRDFLDKLAERSSEQIAPRRKSKLYEIHRQWGEAEERARRALGIGKKDDTRLLEAMADLWGHSLSVERDRLAGPNASAQKRGRITRELREQLREAITDGDD